MDEKILRRRNEDSAMNEDIAMNKNIPMNKDNAKEIVTDLLVQDTLKNILLGRFCSALSYRGLRRQGRPTHEKFFGKLKGKGMWSKLKFVSQMIAAKQ